MMNIAKSVGSAAERADAGLWFAGRAAGAADLRSSVSGLVAALSSYSDAVPDATASALAQGGARSGAIDMATCVAQLADTLAGFQQKRRGAAAGLAAPGSGLGLPAWFDSHAGRAQGWLAVAN